MPNTNSQPGNTRPLPDRATVTAYSLKTLTLPAGTSFYRVHSAEYSPFFYFRDAPVYRFDDPESLFGSLYISRDRIGAFAEAIARTLFTQQISSNKIIFKSNYKDSCLSTLRSKEPMDVIDLNNNINALKLGVTAELMSHDDYSWTQQWSRALYENQAQFDGIYYQAKHAPSSPSIAVFERFPESDFERLDSTPLNPLPLDILQYLDQAGVTIQP